MYGEGIGIAVLDSGIYPHPDFDNRIRYFKDFVNEKNDPYDDNGHGTHVAGILGGSGKASGYRYRSTASSCDLYIYKILDSMGQGHFSHMCKALHELISIRESTNIRIINISLGAFIDSARENELLIQYTEKAWDAGYVVVVAAGNEGPKKGTVTTPGNSKKVITVGAADLIHLKKKSSGRGPTKECVCKPDILAYGSNITACDNKGQGYVKKTGTSMATPKVSSVIACVLEKNKYLSNVEIKMLLRDTAIDLGLERNVQGWGMINEKRLLNI